MLRKDWNLIIKLLIKTIYNLEKKKQTNKHLYLLAT